MCAKKRHTDSKDFLHYLKDDLSNQERHDLERSLEADPFEKEAMEGLESISPEKAEEDILSLHAALNKRLGRRRRRTWYSIAATAASILLVGTIFLNIYDFNPNDKDGEALTEESFRDLNSAKELPAAPASEEPAEDLETETPAYSEEKARSEEPARMGEEKTGEIAEEKMAQKKAGVLAEDVEIIAVEAAEVTAEVEVETFAMMAEDEEIIAIEAKPERSKRSASKEKMAAPVAHEQETADADKQISEPLSGQINGIVLSSEDMEPLPGAIIMIQDLNSGTVADMEGRFIIPTEENQTKVEVSFIGMDTEQYVLKSEAPNELVMQPDALMLDEIVVVAHASGKISGMSTSPSSRNALQEEAPSGYSAAEPPEGYKAYRDYLKENMVFPDAYKTGEREIVVLKFTVNSNGTISDISPLRSPGESYTGEATRLLLSGPAWTSAKVNGDPIDEQVRIRIVFKK